MVHLREDPTYVHFHFASKVCHLTTRIRVRLLGPCFKSGWLKPLCQHLQNAGPALHCINPNAEPKHRSVLTIREAHNGPAARRVLGASVRHGSCAQSQRFLRPLPSKPCPPQRTDAGQRDGMVGVEASSSPGIPPRRIGSNHFSSQQFQALFHSLFKVLSIFPSQYLFAIGLSPIFSFRWSLPPTLACIPKQADSLERPYHAHPTESKTGL